MLDTMWLAQARHTALQNPCHTPLNVHDLAAVVTTTGARAGTFVPGRDHRGGDQDLAAPVMQ